MSKYRPLWQYLSTQSGDRLTMSFDDVAQITGFAFDHAFLTFKKELPPYGWRFEKLSLKNRTVSFVRTDSK